MKTKRRKAYEKARNIVRNNMTHARGYALTKEQSPKFVRAFHLFQQNKKR